MNDGRVQPQPGLRQLAPRHAAGRDPRCGRRRGRGQRRRQIHCRQRTTRPARPRATTSTSTTSMGEVPHGFKPHPGLEKFGNESGLLDRERPGRAAERRRLLVGRVPDLRRQLLVRQHGPDGTREPDGRPAVQPAGPTTSLPGFLPEDCENTAAGPPTRPRPCCCSSASASGRPSRPATAPATGTRCPRSPGTAAAAAEQRERSRDHGGAGRDARGEADRGVLRELAGWIDPALHAVAATAWPPLSRSSPRRLRRGLRARAGRRRRQAVGQELGGSVAQLAQCRDWIEGTEAQSSRRSRTSAARSTSAMEEEEGGARPLPVPRVNSGPG